MNFSAADPSSENGCIFIFCRAQISETTDALNQLEGDLTVVQDSSSEASKELSSLEREARELNLTSEQLHQQLDILKNSNFLGEDRCCLLSSSPGLHRFGLLCLSPGAYDSIRSSYDRSQDAERWANESATTQSSVVVRSGQTRRRTEQLLAAKKDNFSQKNAANKRALGDLSGRLKGLDMKKVNEKVGPAFPSEVKGGLSRIVQGFQTGDFLHLQTGAVAPLGCGAPGDPGVYGHSAGLWQPT